jgi:Domain of unknown function (DUF4157)
MKKSFVKGSQKNNTDKNFTGKGADKIQILSQKNDSSISDPLPLHSLRSPTQIPVTHYNLGFLQRTVGNQAVTKLLRAKSKIDQPGNKYKQEANRMADQVVAMPEPKTQQPIQRQSREAEEIKQKSLTSSITPLVQRQPEEEKPLQGKFASLQRQDPEEEEEVLQGKFTTNESPAQFQSNGDEAENRTGMPDQLKKGLEQLSGMDLSGARVHGNSSKPARINAVAYTQGQDIYMGPGQEKHLPHEGWHAVQQMQGRVKPTMQAQGISINDDAGLEREADVMGAKALQIKEAEKASTDSAHQGSTSLQGGVGTKGESEVLGKAIGTSGEKVCLNFLSTQQNSSTDLSLIGKDAKKVSSLSSVNKKGKVIQRLLPAVFVKYAGEWIAASALGFAAADHVAGSTEGDIKYSFAEMKGVLLPGGGADVASYRKKNPKRGIYRAKHKLAVWYGTKNNRKMGITFSIYFNYDGYAMGNIDMGIVRRHDWPGWAGNIDISMTALSLAGGVASVRIITNLVTHNSWFNPDDEGHLVFTLRADGDLRHTGQGGDTPHNKIG